LGDAARELGCGSRDNGYSASLGASPSPYLDLGVGYTRSVRYALNTVSFSVGVNLGSLAKRNSQHWVVDAKVLSEGDASITPWPQGSVFW